MKILLALALTWGGFVSSITMAAPVCSQYQDISSTDRQKISDTRFELETLDLSLPDLEYSNQFNKILNVASKQFTQASMPDFLQGLVAEAILRRHIYQTFGTDHIAYKRFQIFADLILYHKAMDHKGFVNHEQFTKSKNELEKTIQSFFDELEKEYLDKAPAAEPVLFGSAPSADASTKSLQASAKQFVDLETKRQQMLGALEIVWNQLLQRNQYNRTEVQSDLAITEVSINAASAVVGFSALVGYGPTLLTTARTMWAMPLSIAVGCGFGAAHRYVADGMTASYLQMSRALYKSVQNKTAFSCELGQQMLPTSEPESVVLPYEKPLGTKKDYLMACATTGTAMVFPKAVGIGLSGLLLVSFAGTSYNLVKESIVILQEIPRLYELKEKAKHLQDPKAIEELELQIHQSKTKITLYLLAFGNTSMEAFRQGLFLYGGRGNIKEVIQKAKQFLSGKPIDNIDKKPELKMMSLVLTSMGH